MKLSIILTVYNKESFLVRVLDSILFQENVSSNDYEVIAVDDGSTDHSAEILKSYASIHTHLKIISQKNQGLSMARNNGMLHSIGDYVWFIDADDIISKKSIYLLKNAMGFHPDVIPIYAKTNGMNKIRNFISPSVLSGKDILAEAKWEHCSVFWIMKRQFLLDNNLQFLPKIFHEDADFTPRMLYLAKNVYVIPEILYEVYRGDEKSITSTPHPKRAYDIVMIVERLMIFFANEIEQKSIIGKNICNNNAMILNNAFHIISYNNKNEWKNFNNFLYDRRNTLNCLSKASILKYLIEGFIMKCFPKHYVNIYIMLRSLATNK